jgi:hypothetical protein
MMPLVKQSQQFPRYFGETKQTQKRSERNCDAYPSAPFSNGTTDIIFCVIEMLE